MTITAIFACIASAAVLSIVVALLLNYKWKWVYLLGMLTALATFFVGVPTSQEVAVAIVAVTGYTLGVGFAWLGRTSKTLPGPATSRRRSDRD